jgi:pimeloyl-ACP methyl ester carboxylesterase
MILELVRYDGRWLISSGSRVSLVINDTGTGRPVLVLHGGGGPDTMKPVAVHLAVGYPNGRFALIADAGHLPQLEQPTATIGVIDDFLRTR